MPNDFYVYKDQLFKVTNEFTYIGEPEEFELDPGKYLIMCYGARGGYTGYDETNVRAPHGGFAMGILDLQNTTTMYAVVGGNGANSASEERFAPGGYNGGGQGGISSDGLTLSGCGGGGATDIRLYVGYDPVTVTTVTLPEEYTAIEYIKGQRYQYIDTGYMVNTDTEIEVDFVAPTASTFGSGMCLFGCSNDTNIEGSYPNQYSFWTRADSTNKWRFDAPGAIGSNITAPSAVYNERIKLKMGDYEAYWSSPEEGYHHSTADGVGFSPIPFDESVLVNPSSPTPTLGFLGRHRASGTGTPVLEYGCNTEVYSMTISECGSDKHKYIPVRRVVDGVETTGFYDIVNSNFIEYAQPTVAPDIETREFTYKTTVQKGLLSRIIVAGGGGGALQTDAYLSKYTECCGGGGAFGGVPFVERGYNRKRYPTQNYGAHFGRGQNGIKKLASGGTRSKIGDSGGGGGWYGGFIANGLTNTTNANGGGGGGSSYVLTATSYKPTGYMDGYTMSDFYFTDVFMEAARSNSAKIIIAKAANSYSENDVIHFINNGRIEKVSLVPGQYRLMCNGGNSCSRYNGYEGRGGYTAGTLTLDDGLDLYVAVGGTPSTAIKSSDQDNTFWNGRYSTSLFNGGACISHSIGESCATASGGGTDMRLLRPERQIEQVTIPDGYTELTYIQNTGMNSAYINTSYTHRPNTQIECNCNVEENTLTSNEAVFGSRTNSTAYLSFFSRKSNGNVPCYGCNNKTLNGTGMIYDQDIKIITYGPDAYWYDTNGVQLGTIHVDTNQINGTCPLYIFDENNNNTPSKYICRMKLYSFIVTENTAHKCYCLPCKRDSDNAFGVYDLVAGTFIEQQLSDTSSSYGTGLVAGEPVVEKTVVELYREIDINQSLLSRIIVAGGAGGAGSGTDGQGGAGGGTTGLEAATGGTHGTNPGPGTQEESPHTGDIMSWGGFGYGGLGDARTYGYGGSGGGGWFGGGGTIPDSRNDDDKGGCGGSGYVYTADSFKPVGMIDDPRYYLTDPTMLAGASTDTIGETTASIRVVKIDTKKIIAQDAEGLKYYDHTNETWTTDPNLDEITVENILEFGNNNFTSEVGLIKPYRIYMTDLEDKFNSVSVNVVPNTLQMTYQLDNASPLATITMDIECDDNLVYTVETDLIDAKTYEIKCTFDMITVPTRQYRLYNIFTTSTMSLNGSAHPPIRPYKHLEHVDLMPVGQYDRIPNKFNDYMPPTLVDGSTVVEVNSAKSITYNREIYTLLVVNQSYIRLVKFTLISKRYTVIFDIPNSVLGFKVDTVPTVPRILVGGFILNEDYVYIAQSVGQYIVRVSRTDPTDITKYENIFGYSIGADGDIQWYSPNEICVPVEDGYRIFNTTSEEISKVITYNYTWNVFPTGGVVVTDKYIITIWHWISVLIYDRDTETFSSINYGTTGKPINALYNDDKYLYVGHDQSGSTTDVVSIYDINTMELVRNVVTTENYIDNLAAANGVLYFIDRNYGIGMIKLKGEGQDEYRSIGYPQDLRDMIFKPTTFQSYYFLPDFQLFVVSWADPIKYDFGYKYERGIIQTISDYEEDFVYDENYLTFTDAYLDIHVGHLNLELEEYDEGIKTCENDFTYKEFIDITFNMRGE